MVLINIIFFIFFPYFSFCTNLCQELFRIETDTFLGTPVEGYSSVTKLKVAISDFKDGDIVSLGSFRLTKDVLIAQKIPSGTVLLVKRIHESQRDAKSDYDLMMERESLAKEGHFGALKVPRVIALDGKNVYFEYIEGWPLKEVLLSDSKMIAGKTPEDILKQYAQLIDEIYYLHKESMRFEIFEFELPEIIQAFTRLGFHPTERDVIGGLILVDITKPGFRSSSFRHFGLEILNMEPEHIYVSKDGDLYLNLNSIDYYGSF